MQKTFKKKAILDKINEYFHEIFKKSKDLDGKDYVLIRDKCLFNRNFKNDYEKVAHAHINGNIATDYIINIKNNIDKIIHIYEKYKNMNNFSENFKDKISTSKKISGDIFNILDNLRAFKVHDFGDDLDDEDKRYDDHDEDDDDKKYDNDDKKYDDDNDENKRDDVLDDEDKKYDDYDDYDDDKDKKDDDYDNYDDDKCEKYEEEEDDDDDDKKNFLIIILMILFLAPDTTLRPILK